MLKAPNHLEHCHPESFTYSASSFTFRTLSLPFPYHPFLSCTKYSRMLSFSLISSALTTIAVLFGCATIFSILNNLSSLSLSTFSIAISLLCHLSSLSVFLLSLLWFAPRIIPDATAKRPKAPPKLKGFLRNLWKREKRCSSAIFGIFVCTAGCEIFEAVQILGWSWGNSNVRALKWCAIDSLWQGMLMLYALLRWRQCWAMSEMFMT